MASNSPLRLFITQREMMDARDSVEKPTHKAFRNFIQIEFGKIGYVVEDWSALKYHSGKFTLVKGQPPLQGWMVVGPRQAFRAL